MSFTQKTIPRALLITTLLLTYTLNFGHMHANMDATPLIQLGSKLPDNTGIFYNWGKYSLNLRVVEHNFYLYFLNKDKKVISPPIEKANLRVRTTQRITRKLDDNTFTKKREEIFLTLQPSENGASLTSPRYIKPPMIYWVVLSLLETKNGEENNLKTFDLTQLTQKASDEQTKEKPNY